jgi:hypothetical protein
MNQSNRALMACELIKEAIYEQDTDTRNTMLLKCIGLITGDQSFDVEAAERPKPLSKYHHEIKPGVYVDVYDVLKAWRVTNPALQHLIKKALQPGARGHKTREQDLQDIVDSAVRAKALEFGS